MVIKRDPTPFPLIDSDPHAARVIRYFRPSDYAKWAGAIGMGEWITWYHRRINGYVGALPSKMAYFMSGTLWAVAGFLHIYQVSSFRFMGIQENSREILKDYKEMQDRIKQNLPLYGVSRLSDYGQSAAMRMSTNSQYMFALAPWFNLANHKYHDTDQDYYRGLEHLRPQDYRTTFIGV